MTQRDIARRKANKVRTRRRELKEDIEAGRESAKAWLLTPPEFLLTMLVFDLLMAKPGWGKTKVVKLLRQAGVPATREIGQLTDRQRSAIAELLPW